MMQVSSRSGSPPPVVSNYRYNGLGFRIGWQYHQTANAGGPGIVAADPWYWLVYNDKWQQIAAYRVPGGSGNSWANAAETQPKEVITHHMAGVNGAGGSSYIDSVVMRERDNTAWGDAVSSWALTGRQYLLQNWRADVVLSIDTAGTITDRIRYTAYGEPQRYSLSDLAGGGATATAPDAAIDNNDYTAFINAFGASDPLADVNGDGLVDSNDYILFINNYSAGSDGPLGSGVLSSELDAGFRRGYAGYEFDPVLGASYASVYHVRNRVYDAENGRWTKRDPLGYVDGMGLYEYCKGWAIEARDAFGSCADCVTRDEGFTAVLAAPGQRRNFGVDEPRVTKPRWNKQRDWSSYLDLPKYCTIQIVCRPSFSGQSHCGLSINMNDTNRVELHGTGGDTNWWNVSDPPAPLPTNPTRVGPPTTIDGWTCRNLFQRASDWNTHDFERAQLSNNSNWTLKCLLKDAALPIDSLSGPVSRPLGFDSRWIYDPSWYPLWQPIPPLECPRF